MCESQRSLQPESETDVQSSFAASQPSALGSGVSESACVKPRTGASPAVNPRASALATAEIFQLLERADKARLVVLISGSGTNLQALIDATEAFSASTEPANIEPANREPANVEPADTEAGDSEPVDIEPVDIETIDSEPLNGLGLKAEIVAVISNRSKAYGLERARKHGIETAVQPVKKGESRNDYDKRLAELVASYKPDLVVMAGFMRILTNDFVSCFPIINLHPALPGAFSGTHAIERSFKAWLDREITEAGVMVHWVTDEQVDLGETIATKHVELQDLSEDDFEIFEERIHKAEHILIVEATQRAIASIA